MANKKTKPQPAARATVPLVDPNRIPDLLSRVEAPPRGTAGVKVEKHWYIVVLPLAHRRLGNERMGWVLAFAASEAAAKEMVSEPKLAPGMQRDRIKDVRLASPTDLAWLRALPRERAATRPAWTCWELAGTTAEEY